MSGAQENGGSLGSLGSAVLVQWFCVQPAVRHKAMAKK